MRIEAGLGMIEAALGIRETLANPDFELGGDWLNHRLRRRTRWQNNLYRHGPTAHERRFNPYTVAKTRNEMTNSSSAVELALE